MGTGYLTITVHTGDDALPVANAQITIKSETGEVFYTDSTNENGYTGTFALSCPDASLTLDKDYGLPAYSTCDVDIVKQGFITEHIHGVEIVDTQTAILPVTMYPLPTDTTQEDNDIFIPPVGVLLPTNQQQLGSNQVFLHKDVLIPDYITVHLGAPNTASRNVRVKFADYIKNVASSEIYPTWPLNSLIANIHVITTFALNRVYTEWYRSRGFNFDITNSTAYDQYFVEGRNIFENISNIVDTIFNVYARRSGFQNPFFTQYCNGTTSTCKGLSQWGTVDLANRGLTPLQILHFFYPKDLELITSYNIGGIAESYPGSPIKAGNSGPNVQRMQNFLNRIRVNYPLIPQISNPNGYFGTDTENAVRTFQRTFNLTSDGIIGRATWNKITSVYVGIIRLGELDSEGIRIGIGKTPPSSTIKLGSKGEDVLLLQFILNAIAPFYPAIPSVIKDSYYGNDTKNAVIQFQKSFGLTQDGIVGPGTWNKLYSVYWGVHNNAPVPPAELPPSELAPPFPGTLLRQGSTGPDVRLMQTYLNTIRKVYSSIPLLVVDSNFGPATTNAVIAFQRQFLLTPDGVIGPVTWDKIVQQFLLVTGNATVSTAYPGVPLRVGSTGSGVRLMQTFLTELRTVYPSLPAITVDGIFGNETRAAVIAFQNMFNLAADGVIGPATWNAIVYRRNLHFGA